MAILTDPAAVELAHQLLAGGEKKGKVKRALRAHFGLTAWECEVPIARARARIVAEFDLAPVRHFLDRAAQAGATASPELADSVRFYHDLLTRPDVSPSLQLDAIARLDQLLGLGWRRRFPGGRAP